MRRRRPSNGGRRPRSRGVRRAFGSPGDSGRLLLLVLGVILIGSGSGYLYATQIVFTTPEGGGGAFREIPDLTGMPLEDAGSLLRERGLELGIVDSISHPTVPPGEVLGQTPLPGQLASASGYIELTLSLGPERRPIPDVTRLRAERALTVLETTGFNVVMDSVEAEVPEGRVVATLPEPGAVLPLPAQVRLVVSKGPPLVPMPQLVGLQEEEARFHLDSLGFVPGDSETRFQFGVGEGEVIEHFPPADSLVPAGTSVRLVIGRRGLFQ